MPLSESDLMLERLAQGLDSNTKLAQGLLQEMKESEKDFAAVKTELAILRENVKSLSRVVRDGNGEMSLLTRIAVIDQKTQDIIKWIEGHPKAHERSEENFAKLAAQLEGLERRFSRFEKDISDLNETAKDRHRSAMDSINKEIELAHAKKLSDTEIKEERQKAIIKIVAALMLAVLTFAVGYFTHNGGLH